MRTHQLPPALPDYSILHTYSHLRPELFFRLEHPRSVVQMRTCRRDENRQAGDESTYRGCWVKISVRVIAAGVRRLRELRLDVADNEKVEV